MSRPAADGSIPPERFAEAVDERTALVCCTAVSFRTGHRHDVTSIAEIAHASGALVLADSYQAIGALELDVRTLGADVVTGGTVKYLLGSAGLAFMWLRELASRIALPTQTGWFADEDIFAMSIADYSPHATARRFDSGTPPVPSLYPGVAGMQIIAEVGVPAIQAHVAWARRPPALRARRARRNRCDAARRRRVRPVDLRRLDGSERSRRPACRAANRHVHARCEPPSLAAPLQRRGGRRPHPRGARGEPSAARLTAACVSPACRRHRADVSGPSVLRRRSVRVGPVRLRVVPR